MEPYRSGLLHNSLSYPWHKMCKFIMKYLTLDGRHVEVCGHHIILLNHFRIVKERVNFVDFVRFSMSIFVVKCKNNNNTIPLHQSVMLMVYQHALAMQAQITDTQNHYPYEDEEDEEVTSLQFKDGPNNDRSRAEVNYFFRDPSLLFKCHPASHFSPIQSLSFLIDYSLSS